MHNTHWLLPEAIADILAFEADRIEYARQLLLNCFHLHGYLLVLPPLLEYSESLLAGTGHQLDLKTFKLVDQLSGRLLGARADITPQVARIDASYPRKEAIRRFCYIGSVLHTRPARLFATREPLQMGAEIFGTTSLHSDLEIQQLLLKALTLLGFSKIRLDLCHLGIIDALLESVDQQLAGQLSSALLSKDHTRINQLSQNLPLALRHALRALPQLYGSIRVLSTARTALAAFPAALKALDELQILAKQMSYQAQVTIDLADYYAVEYHSGIVFSAYLPGISDAIACGGRYDKISQIQGHTRCATGFSFDLRELVRIANNLPKKSQQTAILAPLDQDDALQKKITELRAVQQVVIQAFPNQQIDQELYFIDRILVKQNQQWVVCRKDEI